MSFGSRFRVCIVLGAILVCGCGIVELGSAAEDRRVRFSTAVLIRVDSSGLGDYEKIQDAIDVVPANNNQLYFIWVKPGIYSEQVVVPADKPYITLSGTQASTTILTWNEGGDIFESPTLTVLASHFVARYVTIQNTYRGRAVALRVAGDKAAFYSCRILSYQDTILDDFGSHYFKNCYIEGATDFICGSGSSLYERCHLHVVIKEKGIITAHRRQSESEDTGFTFLGCKITGIDSNSTYLGRPWGPYSRVIFAYTYMSSAVLPEGWDDWNNFTRRSTVYYGEYKNFGPGSDKSKRVAWSQTLSDLEVKPFMSKNKIGGRGWLRPSPKHFITSKN
uniref:pectinesterase n=1 Tax=Kalanchoe fedtschenkoi TaxID=63787 RepID=A0A7N0ZR98_KALFE